MFNYPYLDVFELYNNNNFNLYNNNMNFEDLNKNDFHKNILFKYNYNYFNNVHSINEFKTNENICNENNKNSLELKNNDNDLNDYKQTKKLNKKRNRSIKNKKNKFKIIHKIDRYRGVTKNKKKWQVYICINNKNTYLGTYESEITAAKIYDLMAIKKDGYKAKTNFKYNNEQIDQISKIDININNLFDIISKIFI